jgi:hypothetical protein
LVAAGIFSSLAVNFLSRFFRSETILFAVLVISIVPLCLTPLFTDSWFQLAIVIISGRVQTVGLNLSFYIIGAMLLVPMIFIVPAILRNHVKSGSQAVGK